MTQPIESFPIRKTCTKGRGAKHSCERATVLCGMCLRRVCAHLSNLSVRIDLDTGKHISPMDTRATGITLGTCGSCKGERGGWSMADAIERIKAAI